MQHDETRSLFTQDNFMLSTIFKRKEKPRKRKAIKELKTQFAVYTDQDHQSIYSQSWFAIFHFKIVFILDFILQSRKFSSIEGMRRGKKNEKVKSQARKTCN